MEGDAKQACSVKCLSRDTGITDSHMLFILLQSKNFLLYSVFDEITDLQFSYLKQRKRQSVIRRQSRALEATGILNRTSISVGIESNIVLDSDTQKNNPQMYFGKKKGAVYEKIGKVRNLGMGDEHEIERRTLGQSESVYVTGREGQGLDIEEKGITNILLFFILKNIY